MTLRDFILDEIDNRGSAGSDMTDYQGQAEDALAELDALEAEVEALKLALMGGEDASGYAASRPASEVIESHQKHQRDLSSYFKGIDAQNWKLRDVVRQAQSVLAEFRDPDMTVPAANVFTRIVAAELACRAALGETQ